MTSPLLKELLNDSHIARVSDALGWSSFPMQERGELLAYAGELLLSRLLLELLKKVPEAELPEFDRLRDSGDVREMRAFLERHIENLPAFCKAVVEGELRGLQPA